LPEGAFDTHDVAAGQLSTTTGVSAGAVAVHSPEAALMVRLAGQIIVGANTSGEHCDQPAMTLAHKIVIVRKNALTDIIGYLMSVFFLMGHFFLDKRKRDLLQRRRSSETAINLYMRIFLPYKSATTPDVFQNQKMRIVE
jgi:hypothetical protein